MSSPSEPLTGTEIAVVGMAARLPGAATLDEFWRNLRDGVESVRRFTQAELLDAGEPPALLADPDYVPARPVLAHVDQFDAGFFGFSPQDAAIMDPQHRVFLEVGWEAMEHAGHDPGRFAGNIGVFATCGMNTYMMYHLVTNRRIMETVGEWLVRHTGNDMNFLATRLSYQLGLKGPSMNVQTACSSALVAIHLASQSLLNGECDMAMAGGSVIALPQDRGYLYKKGEILSPDGHCRTFDAQAAGTLFGSGAGVVVLRRLTDALAEGDRVLAIVRGSAVNNDGAMKVGYLAPGVEGQSRAVAEALAVSGVSPETISYVEAHGTATLVGDPIEITALTDAYRHHTDKRGFCAIGSLKSNIGHLGEAAGVAGFIKTVLSLQHRQIPPSLHYDTPNPRIDFAGSPFFVNARLRDWVSPGSPRRAGITALGAGGTNCHLILEEAPPAPVTPPAARAADVIVLSAKTATALDAMTARLASHLEADASINLTDAAYTLQAGRHTLTHRRAFVCRGREEAVQVLRAGAPHASASGDPKPQPVVFLFPGGGAQYPDMGVGIYLTEPIFREAVDRCLSLLRTRHAIDLRPMLFPAAGDKTKAAKLLEQSTNSILSIFTIEYALAQLWIAWGIKPAAMTGHSVGEYAAACIAGVFSLEDALAIVHARGAIFDRLPPGAMLSVPLPEADLRARLRGSLGVAAVNAPALSVVSGTAADIDAFERELASRGVEARRLPITVAAHSSMLDPFLDEFHRRVASARLSPPTIPFISNLSGRWIRAEEATDPAYWVKHLRQTVRFSDGLAALLERRGQVLLEVGPGRTLSSLARQQPAQAAAIITSLRHRDEEVADDQFLLGAVARLWANGASPDWSAFHAGLPRQRVALPTYPFERRRHWIPAGQPLAPAAGGALVEVAADPVPAREPDIADWFSRPIWTNTPPPAASRDLDGDLLVFDDESGLGRAIADELLREAAAAAPVDDAARGATRLEFPTPGEAEGARLAAVERTAPGAGQVEIAVRAAALNFSDALKVTGVQPDAPFGMECAGVITRIGDGVVSFAVGDEVIAISPDSFRSHVLREARVVTRKPAALSWQDAATLPVAFMTAVYALETLAELRPGDRVLIHSASGGVGLAAAQVAKARGAEIFATAGSPEKRQFLESIGIQHVFHSRTLDFADAIRARTGGAGVDVVLNSLTGEFLTRSLHLLAPRGRFVELGKKEIYTPEQLAALGLAAGVSYHAMDLAQILRDDPAHYGALLADVVGRVARGELQPLPHRAFPTADAARAFDLIIRAKHIGKIVLEFDTGAPRVWMVEAGESFAQLGPSRFAVHPARAEDYAQLFEALGTAAKNLRRVLHLWNVDASTRANTPASAQTDARLERSFFSPLRIAQAIGRQELAQPLDVTLVSTGVQRVAGESSLDPVKATLQGPARVLPRELPNVACRQVDIETPVSAWQRRRAVTQLARELRSPVSETTIAYRGADRWVQHYVRTRLDAAPAVAPVNGAHLITGGMGGLGLEIAEHLAASGSKQIVLLGRTALPPRDEWDAWLSSHGADDADTTSHRIRKVRACEALGADVLLLAGDVSDLDDMRRVVTEARARFGRVAGVFHTAGALDDGLMQLKTDESALAVLRPKVQGTLVLDEVLADDPADFLVLFSSVSAVLGLQGQVDYVAANAFLDAFAQLRASGPTRVVSANWCAWRGVGLAASASQARHQAPLAASAPGPHPWLERRRKSATGETTFTTSFDVKRQWVVGEHVTLGGDALMPGTGYLELARAAMEPLADRRPIELSQVYFHAPFVLPANESRELELTLRPLDNGYEWTIHSAATTHATGKASLATAMTSASMTASTTGAAPRELRVDLAAIRARCTRRQLFAGGVLDQHFMAFGPRWANLLEVGYGEDEALALLALPAAFAGDVETFRLHPALLDLATGGAQALIPGFDARNDFYVPFSYGRVLVLDALPARVLSHVRLAPGTGNGLAMFNVSLLDEGGRVIVDIAGFCMKRVDARQLVNADDAGASAAAGAAAVAGASAGLSDTPRQIESATDLAEEMLRLGMLPAEGLDALDRLIAGPAMPQVVVSPVDLGTWQALLARQTRAEAARVMTARAATGGTTGAATAGGATAGAGPSAGLGTGGEDIESRLAAIWSEILGVQQVAPQDNFFELGGHSLLAVRLLTRVERIFGRAVSMPELFRTPTIAGIAAILRDDQPGARAKEPALLPISRDAFRVSRKRPTS
jgi:acyl transferase domain-containing protein/NADPH-dependent curcumin reductase CurA/acyl carrier protein